MRRLRGQVNALHDFMISRGHGQPLGPVRKRTGDRDGMDRKDEVALEFKHKAALFRLRSLSREGSLDGGGLECERHVT